MSATSRARVGAAALALAAAALAGCGRRSHLPPPPPVLSTQEGGRIHVPDGSPLRRELALDYPRDEAAGDAAALTPATVELDPARQVRVLPPVAGRVLSLAVTLGEHVRAGQVLARMVSPDLAQALDDDRKARSALDLAAKAQARAAAALAIGGGSQKDLQQTQADHAQAQAEAVRAAARLQQLNATGRAGGGVLSLVAPRAGEVTDLAVAPGAYANDLTAPLMTVADTSVVWVAASVAEDQLAQVRPGQAAQVRFDALPGRVFDGRVLFVAAQLDPDTRRVKARIALPNPGGALRPNMFATVRFAAPARRGLTVADTALLFGNSETYVLVETAPWTFERRVVETGAGAGGRTAVISGLRPDQRVVSRGGVLLDD